MGTDALAPGDNEGSGVGDSGFYTKEELEKAPRSFVFHRGKILRRNNLRDFVTNAAPLGVTHLLVFTRSEAVSNQTSDDLDDCQTSDYDVKTVGTSEVKPQTDSKPIGLNGVTNVESAKGTVQLRIIRLPHGPTVTFKVLNYSLVRDVISSLKRPYYVDKHFQIQPLVVMSGFGNGPKRAETTENCDELSGRHLSLVCEMFQNMFPPISVDSMQVSRVRRCATLNHDSATGAFDFRHYAIKLVPSGVSRPVKKLIQKKVPNLAKYEDISDFVLNPGNLSESEAELDSKEIELASEMVERGVHKGGRVNVRLVELGPRMSLRLFKIEAGLSDGEVLFHADGRKSRAETAELRKRHAKMRHLKEARRKEQERHVQRKIAERELHKKKCLEGQKNKPKNKDNMKFDDNSRDGSQVELENRKRKLSQSSKSDTRKTRKM